MFVILLSADPSLLVAAASDSAVASVTAAVTSGSTSTVSTVATLVQALRQLQADAEAFHIHLPEVTLDTAKHTLADVILHEPAR